MPQPSTSQPQALSQWATFNELQAQPDIWRAWGPTLAAQLPALQAWLRHRPHDEVWFCGAGTSSFIGEALVAYLNSRPGLAKFRAVPSTDLVAQPMRFLRLGVVPLVVSFGRSGDSSESVGTLDLLDELAPQAHRLHITCNAQSTLATRAALGPGDQRHVVLPSATNDTGFAMTASFTTLLLTALALFDEAPPLALQTTLDQLAQAAQSVLAHCAAQASSAALSRPERVVFLGSGVLTAAARESCLKVLELTVGAVPTLWDSTLGFRHGPKAFMTPGTRAYVLVSAQAHAQRYDLDVAAEIRRQFGAATVVTVGPHAAGCDVVVDTVGNDAWTAVAYVVLAQYLSVAWSHSLGLTVDNPFTSGNLSRVVSGVTLYPYGTP